ncbi:MAG: hypothetical protein ACR2LA_10325 [Acidimicrobiales bacterium]
MARTSCIRHARRSHIALLREDYLRICGGNACAAMILSQMEHWNIVKLEAAGQAQALNEAARRAGEEATQDTERWVYKSLPEMKEELMGLFGDKAISAGFAALIAAGFLEQRTNPKFTWDRTRQYRFHTENVQADIDQLGETEPNSPDEEWRQADQSSEDTVPMASPNQRAELPGCKPQICGLEGAKLRLGGRRNAAAISETTPKVTNKDESTLNVGHDVNCVSFGEQGHGAFPPIKYLSENPRSLILDSLTAALVQELSDIGSEKRHRQLLDICERNGLDELPKQALLATRRRLAQEHEQGILEKPGAYYQKILIGLLEDHQVFVPPAGSRDEQASVRRLALDSLNHTGLQQADTHSA